MADLKKILIIFVVAILFSIFVFTLIDAVYPNPEYSDYCKEKFPLVKPIGERVNCEGIDVSPADWESCDNRDGTILYNYDSEGCATSYECSLCRVDYDEARSKHAFVMFIVSAIFGILAIVGGVWLPNEKNPLNEWVGTGFMFGGLITIFFGTAVYFGDLHRVWRPIVILVELLLVLWLAYKKLGPTKKSKK